jgi:hypothetical protein
MFVEACTKYIGLPHTFRIVNRVHKICGAFRDSEDIEFVHFGEQIHVEQDSEPLVCQSSDMQLDVMHMMERMMGQHNMEKYIGNLVSVRDVS